jgi:hypothetical protein
MTKVTKVWNATQGLVKYNENGNVVAPAETVSAPMNIVMENALVNHLLVIVDSPEEVDAPVEIEAPAPKKVKKVHNLENAEIPAEQAPVEVIPTIGEDVAASEVASEVQSSEEELHEEGQ